MTSMGLQYGLWMSEPWNTQGRDDNNRFGIFKRRFRWLLKIQVPGEKDGDSPLDVSATGVNALPPSQSARPSISFKEQEAKHLTESFYYPMRPDWRPIQLILYDVLRKNGKKVIHPVFEWLKKIYDPKKDASWFTATEKHFITTADLYMLDGCGTTIEHWVYENVWPQVIDFGRLEMNNSEVMTCDLTLRYARAYFEDDVEVNQDFIPEPPPKQ